jgi:hypothetical protein
MKSKSRRLTSANPTGFKEAARQIGADQSTEAFDQILKKLSQRKNDGEKR